MLLVSDVANVIGVVALLCHPQGRLLTLTTASSAFGRAMPYSGQVRAIAVIGSSRRMCYLVDPASSHMLVSKIKPCMCKYELIRTVKLRMAH